MQSSNYNTPLYRLIQLVSVIFFSTLTPGYAKMQQKVAPPLSLKVDSNNLKGHNRIIKVTITNTSMELEDLARCRLVAAEELNKSVNIHYKNIVGSVVKMDWKKEMPYLQKLIDTEALNQPGASQTCTILLEPNNCRAAELSFSVIDENWQTVGGPVYVKWSVQSSFFVPYISAIYDGIKAVAFWLSFYRLCYQNAFELSSGFDTLRALFYFRKYKSPEDLPPRVIKAELDKHVVGQESAKIHLATIGHNHLKRIQTSARSQAQLAKHNVLIIGPTGTGKTLLVDKLAQILGVPFYKADANSFTAAGYVGEDVEQVFNGLVTAAGGNLAAAAKGIIFIDEIDKIAANNKSFHADVGGKQVQDALLTLLQGTEITVNNKKNKLLPGLASRRLNIKNILFICAGAFESMKNPQGESTRLNTTAFLKSYGMTPELLGRLPCIIRLDPLDIKTLIKILKDLPDSPINQWIADFESDGIQLTFTEDAIEYIIQEANRIKLGARGLNSVLVTSMSSLKYNASAYLKPGEKKIEVTPDVLTEAYHSINALPSTRLTARELGGASHQIAWHLYRPHFRWWGACPGNSEPTSWRQAFGLRPRPRCSTAG